MPNSILLILVGIIIFNNGFTQDYLKKVAEEVCKCSEDLDEDVELEEYLMQFGFCILNASMPYEKNFKKDYDIVFEGTEYSEKLGEIIGMELAVVCPDVLLKVYNKVEPQEDEETYNDLYYIGKITKIEDGDFVVFTLIDDYGKAIKLHWLTFVESDVELTENYHTLLDKTVEISYFEEELFDPTLQQYRKYRIIISIKPVTTE